MATKIKLFCEECGKEKEYWVTKSTKRRRFCSRECFKKSMKNEKNVNWKGSKVGLYALHEWVKKYIPKPKLCEKCKLKQPYDLANISGKYKRDINDFEWLCRSCHMKKDGRMNNLKHQSVGHSQKS